MKIKNILLTVLASALLLTGCSSQTESTPGTGEVEDEMSCAEYKDINTTCGLYYKEFLKFGGQEADTISSDNPDWTYSADGTKETWGYDGGSALKLSYWRDSSENVSYYTRTFPINTGNISSWVDVEVVGIDNLLGTVHERTSENGVTWNYTWQTDLENCILQVYSTGEYGRYTGLISFTRSGPTSYSQLPDGGSE